MRDHVRPTTHSPFGPTTPAMSAAAAYASATLLWIALGPALPGGRWLAVHLFTLGVVTNLVLSLSDHFGRTLTRAGGRESPWQTPVVNAGIVLVLVGLPSGRRWAVAVGAAVVAAVVAGAAIRLRRLRRRALGARFGWIVEQYERAHVAFLVGALVGMLLGLGALTGDWYGAGRVAHLHVNVLGWAGLTLLATIVFFGPTIVRTRIVAGADVRAAAALARGAAGLAAAVVLLLAAGIGGAVATALHLAAAVAMSLYARAVTITCLPTGAAARGAKPTATRAAVVAACWWFPLVAWADVVVVATGAWQWLDVVGLAMLLGVLAQTIAAAATYLAPMLRARSTAARDAVRRRLERGATTRTTAFNLGVVGVVSAAVVGGTAGAALSDGGWTLVVLSMLWLLVAMLAPTAGKAEHGAR